MQACTHGHLVRISDLSLNLLLIYFCCPALVQQFDASFIPSLFGSESKNPHLHNQVPGSFTLSNPKVVHLAFFPLFSEMHFIDTNSDLNVFTLHSNKMENSMYLMSTMCQAMWSAFLMNLYVRKKTLNYLDQNNTQFVDAIKFLIFNLFFSSKPNFQLLLYC